MRDARGAGNGPWGWRHAVAIAGTCLGVGLGMTPAGASAAPTTTLVDVGSNGAQADQGASLVSVSANGRWVAFASTADNLVAGDTNAAGDVFLRDRLTGTTQRVDVGPNGAQSTGAGDPYISGDGRYVAFDSSAANLVPGVTGQHVYRYDRVTGALIALPVVSGYSTYVTGIDADGGRIVLKGNDSSNDNDVFWWNAATGAVTRLDQTAAGVRGNGDSRLPVISADGTHVAFQTIATNLVPTQTQVQVNVVVADLDAGTLIQASVPNGGGTPNGASGAPAIDGDGCVVAFTSEATNLVAGDDGSGDKAFVRDLCTGTTELASISATGAQATDPGDVVSISADGCGVAFETSDGTSPAPASGYAAVMHNRCTGATTQLDVANSGQVGQGQVIHLGFAVGSSRYVALLSAAGNLDPSDTYNGQDAFVRDLDVNQAPDAELSVSTSGSTVTANTSASSDPDGYQLSSSIDFGDGSAPQPVVQAVHTYPTAGSYIVTATVTDSDGATSTRTALVTVSGSASTAPAGGTTGGGLTPTGTGIAAPPAKTGTGSSGATSRPTALSLSAVTLSHHRFAAATHIDATHGSRLTIHLSRAATVTLRFEQARHGHRVHGHCSATAAHGAACATYVSLGTVRKALPAGTSTLAIVGVVGDHLLAPGTYRLLVSGQASGSAATAPRTLTFTIVGSPSHGGSR